VKLQKNTKIFNHNLKEGDPIQIIFGTNIPDNNLPSNDHPVSHLTTCRKSTNEIALHFYLRQYYYLIKITHNKKPSYR